MDFGGAEDSWILLKQSIQNNPSFVALVKLYNYTSKVMNLKNSSSYDISKISNNLISEINRLEGQVNLFWDKEFLIYKKYGLRNKIKILEVGSGPGFFSNQLLSCLTDIELHSLEIDSSLIDFAKKNTIQNLNTHKIIHGSIEKTSIEDSYYDIVIARLVLEHLDDPISATLEMYRVLKPEGKIFVIDNDFEQHLIAYPMIEGLTKLYTAYSNARIKQGGNPFIGRELPTILKRCGFLIEGFEVLSAHSEIVGKEAFKKSEGIGIASQLIREGYLNPKDFANILKQWKEMLDHEHNGIIRQLYLAIGKKSFLSKDT